MSLGGGSRWRSRQQVLLRLESGGTRPVNPASPGLPEVPERWHGTVRIVAAAGIALAAVVALRTVAR